MNVGILGHGEIGQALEQIIKKHHSVFWRTRKRDNIKRKKIEVLHITIPYSKTFVKTVIKTIKELKPRLVLIESTVGVGTTRKISEKTNCLLAHSPIRGVHPNLYKGIKTFVKFIGGIDRQSADEAATYYKKLRLKTFHCIGPETTELGKILSTTYYGWNIVFQKEVFKLCQKFKVDPGIAYDLFNLSYNAGYTKLGMEYVVRPILRQVEGPIGGHCVQMNAVMLHEQTNSDWLKIILREGQVLTEKKKVSRSLFPQLEDKTWLYCEYVGKEKSSEEIGREIGCTGANVLRALKKWGISRRNSHWTKEQLKKIIKLSEEGKDFREIANEIEEKTYNAVRNVAYKYLFIKSSYDPSIRDEKVREKISISLQGIEPEEWTGFKESTNALIRKSKKYQEWRKKVFKRNNYTCQKCGKRNCYLVAHHLRPFSKYPKLRFRVNNGITLCRDCHYEAHSRTILQTK